MLQIVIVQKIGDYRVSVVLYSVCVGQVFVLNSLLKLPLFSKALAQGGCRQSAEKNPVCFNLCRSDEEGSDIQPIFLAK